MADDKKVVTKKTTAKTADKDSRADIGKSTATAGSASATGVPKKTTARKAPAPEPTPRPAAAPDMAAKRPAPRKAPPPGSVEDRAVTLKPAAEVTPEERWRMVADAAYYRAERRNFAPGYEQEDWLSAEAEVDALLRQRAG